MVIPSSLNFFAMSLGDSLEIYNQNLHVMECTWRRMRSWPSQI